MTTVTSLTADRQLAIEAASVVDGDVIGGNLILTKHDGSQINAGPVTGPQGPQGPVGSDLAVLSAIPVLDVGLANQIRAGRQLGPADFGNIGLSAPIGLWNLSDLSDVSGNGRNLVNKGAVPFTTGINGGANTAAQFVASPAQVLYISDTGVNDPFRIKTGSWGCWFRTAKRAVNQYIVSKHGGTSGNYGWLIAINAANNGFVQISLSGTDAPNISGVSDICDNRWHHMIGTFDGSTLRLYVDGILEASLLASGSMYGTSGVFNIGAWGADGGTNASNPTYGPVDEAFVTSDVLSEDQIRNLYCAKILHTLAAVPSRVSLNVRRRKKGSAFVAADFPAQPLRLHNFSGGSLGDEGSGGVALTNNGAAVSVAGVDGASGNAFSFAGAQSLSATDAALPSALAPRSYGCWIKTAATGGAAVGVLGWGTLGTADIRLIHYQPNGSLIFQNGTDNPASASITDGQWHFAVCVEDNGAIDGVKRKGYLDGRLVVASTTMVGITLAGANRFRLGSMVDGTGPFTGQIDSAFVCDYVLTLAQILALYAKGSQALAPSPKSVGEHVEAMDANSLLVAFDTLDSQHQIDLKVAA